MAHADPETEDAEFIGILEQHGLGCGEKAFQCSNDQQLMNQGHVVCMAIDGGESPAQALELIYDPSGGQPYPTRGQASCLDNH